MNILQFPRMLISTHEGWDELARRRLEIGPLFRNLVFPLSLLPPLMILSASGTLGPTLFPDTHLGHWIIAAVFFFIAEHISVPLMASAIRLESIAKGGSASRRDAYAVAAVAPVPLWLSSLALFASNPWVIVAIAVAALLAVGVLVHNGVERLLGVEEEIEASELAVRVISLGVLAWVVLLMVALVPLLVT